MTEQDRIQEILEFWFGELDQDDMSPPEKNKLWFLSTDIVDKDIRERFGADVARAIGGALDHWADDSQGLVALVLLLDQFTRNIYRGTEAAFSGDDKALALARAAVQAEVDQMLPIIHRVFLYIPFEHAEDLDVQEQGVACFDRLLEQCTQTAYARIDGFRNYMIAHRDVIARFGRFPHRNKIFGRESTAEEIAHLEKHGGF
jgi:uncharacterized protein (DUF924 family)